MTRQISESFSFLARLMSLLFLASSLSAQQPEAGEIDDALWKILDNARPSVVTLLAYGANGGLRDIGSGFAVSDDGLIVTNLKILDGTVRIEMLMADERTENLELIALTDLSWGVALLRGAGVPPPLYPGEAQSARIGEEIIAIGSPKGVNVTLSQGKIVSRIRHRANNGLLQISNDFSPGMNGGPVLNMDGEVIGMLTSVVRSGRPVHLAIPANVLQTMIAATTNRAAEQDLKKVRERIANLKTELDEMRPGLEAQCSSDDLSLIDSVINNAIRSGAVVYNQGDPLACYRIYEGASYQMLYRLKDRCKIASRFLERTLFEATTARDPGQYDSIPAAQAWIMRSAFDSLTGDRNRLPLGRNTDDKPPPARETDT
ncbi:MAG: serine protease [Gammaproteobacteria bacterium]|nr:serine protease [Gammaproteobacteria bacterium]MCZ6827925.1 serine protease [Gammaproteobacteria bacterium]MCZ6911566.1 serine protease [Pseudomonadota bacterium]